VRALLASIGKKGGKVNKAKAERLSRVASKGGKTVEERPIGRRMQDADREAREASLIRRTVQERAVVQVLEKLGKHKNCAEKSLQLALSWLVQDAGFETKKALLRARGLDAKEAHSSLRFSHWTLIRFRSLASSTTNMSSTRKNPKFSMWTTRT
jgi:hypothetical protein